MTTSPATTDDADLVKNWYKIVHTIVVNLKEVIA